MVNQAKTREVELNGGFGNDEIDQRVDVRLEGKRDDLGIVVKVNKDCFPKRKFVDLKKYADWLRKVDWELMVMNEVVDDKAERTVIFCGDDGLAEELYEFLAVNSVPAEVLKEDDLNELMEDFESGITRVLIVGEGQSVGKFSRVGKVINLMPVNDVEIWERRYKAFGFGQKVEYLEMFWKSYPAIAREKIVLGDKFLNQISTKKTERGVDSGVFEVIDEEAQIRRKYRTEILAIYERFGLKIVDGKAVNLVEVLKAMENATDGELGLV